MRTATALAALTAALWAWQPAQAEPTKFYTVSTLKSGDQYAVPRLWTAKVEADHVLLAPPEKDASIALVTVDGASDAASAVQKAWSIYKPKAEAAKLDAPNAMTSEDGWDERKTFSFTVNKSPIQAVALRKGTHWLVDLTDAPRGASEAHSGTISVVRESLLPAGYKPESFVGRKPHHMDAERLQKLKTFISDSMAKLGIPGAALAVVDNGKVVAEEGFGVRELGKPDPVTPDSLFMIGSNTKGLTTLLVAKTIDEGKMSWDKPVTDYYPQFKLGNAELTKKIMIRHLACACTGMPRQDLEWALGTDGHSPASLTFDFLATQQPTTPFGEEFQYSNLMVSAIGLVAGHVQYPALPVGEAYGRAIREKVFLPLGMTSTTFDFAKVQTLNHTSPHGIDFAGKPAVATKMFDYPAVAPAGTAWSTVGDMIKYVENEITEGKAPDGKQLFSAKNVLERRIHNVSSEKDTYYGIGLWSSQLGGIPFVRHGGATSGHLSQWWAIPDAKIGAIILTNSSQGRLLLEPLARKLFELIYDGQNLAEAQVAVAAQNAAADHAKSVKDAQPSVPADVANGLANRYVSPALGHIDVRKTNGEVYFDFGVYGSRMGSKITKDSVTLLAIDPTASMQFTVGKRDGKSTLTVRDGQHEYEYKEAGSS